MVEVLSKLGEKEIIRSIIKPLFNPSDNSNLAGDDCAVIPLNNGQSITLSTDRVPADLISYKLGLINHFELGYYLAVLNISDVISSGATPQGILLNLAFPGDFSLSNFKDILEGAKRACEEYDCVILGGDLTSSIEMSLSATSVGLVESSQALYRKGSKEHDVIYCTDYVGLTPTAFKYFLEAKDRGLKLEDDEEELLIDQFRKIKARPSVSKFLSKHAAHVTAMDNTDGVGQCLLELSELNKKRFQVIPELLPIHPVTYKVAEYMSMEPKSLALAGGADLQLIGTIDPEVLKEDNNLNEQLHIIGSVEEGEGVWVRENDGVGFKEYKDSGWNYF